MGCGTMNGSTYNGTPTAELCGSVVQYDAFATLTTSHEIVGPSRKRRRITFMGPNTGRVTLSNNTPVTLDNGITLTLQSGPLELCLYAYGDCVQKPWYAIYVSGSGPASWIEVMEP